MPVQEFQVIPLLQQAKALYAGYATAKAMRYRSEHANDNVDDPLGTMDDIYDSELYRKLAESNVVVAGRLLPHKYFQDPRDVLLIGQTDGFRIFKRSKQTCWPLIYINANLDPADRYSVNTVLCGGIIPGPNKPKDFDSFSFAVAEELGRAAIGVPAYDAYADEAFTLRLFNPFFGGDSPASALAQTGGKSPGAQLPCKGCPIKGIRIAGTSNNSYYLPLQRPPGYPPATCHLQLHFPSSFPYSCSLDGASTPR